MCANERHEAWCGRAASERRFVERRAGEEARLRRVQVLVQVRLPEPRRLARRPKTAGHRLA
ncbi:hypothetical protein [Rhodocaloribacter sp.]